MILDANLIFDPAGTAITASAASTNVLDMLNARDMGVGDHPALKLLILSNGLFAAGGAATLDIQIEASPDNATWTGMGETSPLSIAQLNAGGVGTKLFNADLPRAIAGQALPRYYRLNYVVATGPFTAGAVQAYLVQQMDQGIAYPPGLVVAN